MKTAAVFGCSLSSGYKMGNNPQIISNEDPAHPRLWSNQLLKHWGYDKIENFSAAGLNNDSIFQTCVENILPTRYDLVLVQWTFLNRENLDIGLELYQTRSCLENSYDINLVDHVTISGHWLDNLGDRIRAVSNVHWKILKLIRYVNVLNFIQKNKNANIMFVNGACYWPDFYFNKTDYNYPSDLPDFTQKILQVDQRDNEEIKKIYDMIYHHYEKNQGIQQDLWLNLYRPLLKMKIDVIEENDNHPGWQSQDLFFKYLKNCE